ncbi:GyrI-like domain-containing protein [Actinoplanes sp. NPDC049596]|uniref:GyrI-like domain-containing protein n=1 Tax=unclassified Actinoplanes TaxID=2626549 RepID=UPI0034183DEE
MTAPALDVISTRPVLVAVPPRTLLVIEGTGERHGAHFRAAAKALYTVSSAVRRALAARHSLPPPEGRWPSAGTEQRWHLMMAQPPQLTARLLEDAATGQGVSLPAGLRLQHHAGGLCVQTLHVGPYRQVHATVDRMRDHMRRCGYEDSGDHHEIYLSNPNRTAPDKLRTVVRHPVRPDRRACH